MIDTVLFDLDGTIIDTNELIINSFLHVMKDLQVSTPWTREQIIPHMGGHWKIRCVRSLGKRMLRSMSKDIERTTTFIMMRWFSHFLM